LFARELEAAGRARATVTRRLSTVAGLYRYGVEEDLLDHSLAVYVRRPWRRHNGGGTVGVACMTDSAEPTP
jgi:site-specific recombinase XerD